MIQRIADVSAGPKITLEEIARDLGVEDILIKGANFAAFQAGYEQACTKNIEKIKDFRPSAIIDYGIGRGLVKAHKERLFLCPTEFGIGFYEGYMGKEIRLRIKSYLEGYEDGKKYAWDNNKVKNRMKKYQ